MDLLKKKFITAIGFTGLNVANAISFQYVSMTNQECKVRPAIVNINNDGVGDINMHLQQKTLIEKCSVNKGVLQKSIMHCTVIFLL